MSRKLMMNAFGGYLETCSVFDFIKDVRREYCPEYHQQIRTLAQKFYDSNMRRYVPESSLNDPVLYAESIHRLTMNPMKLLTELRKTTTKKQFTKHLTLTELVWEMTRKSHEWMGRPTHLFNIGENTFALVAEEDCRLFVKEDMSEQLVCLRPERNFHIIAKNVRFDV